ncbi:hypothetical protein SAVCW2_11990 [Streptomyces avermitilis]|uniref:Amidohydrolase-related domain-containing protein n=1 Tax=Streptomyces avermitilis TaxID=33903 RepID=A0A4D4MMA4_STRAX|nr:hypothetical protein SAV31267_023710 [Streptomyces avermitilis]GDY82000.1 hypothetical protein SAVCW2_11990 [Streptomyces avermitilis]
MVPVDVHVHPKSPCGQHTLSAKALATALEEIRSQVRVPIGATTGAWGEPDPAARVARVREWTVLPDHASVNRHEPGAEGVAGALLERKVAVEAASRAGEGVGDVPVRTPRTTSPPAEEPDATSTKSARSTPFP